jgi:heterotetrameric sarcosine oxidase delta subunit
MIINHPLLGPRDSAEFTYLGDAKMIERPDWESETAAQDFYEYAYLRDNPAGIHRELSYLVVTRDTVTHEISNVELARDVARKLGRSK